MTRNVVAWADFSPVLTRQAGDGLAPLTGKRPAAAPGISRPPGDPDIATLLEAAREEGRRDGEARAGRAAAQALAAQAEEATAGLAAERRRWADTEAATIATTMREQMQALEDRLAAAAAQVLLPFLADALRQQALRELRDIVSPLAEGGCATVSISGPEDLVTRLADRLGSSGCPLVTRFDDAPDIRVQVNDTTVETRLQAWGERLRQLLEDN